VKAAKLRGHGPSLAKFFPEILNRDVIRGQVVHSLLKTTGESQFSSYTYSPIAGGFIAKERLDRFKAEAFTEIVLRSVGILMTVGPIFFIVAILSVTKVLPAPHALVALAMCSAMGLLIYAYGSRGFRRQMSLDVTKGQISVTKINVNGNGRVETWFDLKDIKSIYVQRPEWKSGTAKLCLRAKGRTLPVTLISGGLHEVRLLQRILCETIAPEPKTKKHRPLLPAAIAKDVVA